MKHQLETHLHPSLRGFPLPILAISADGQIRATNEAFSRLVGVAAEGMNVVDLQEPGTERLAGSPGFRFESLGDAEGNGNGNGNGSGGGIGNPGGIGNAAAPAERTLTFRGARGPVTRTFLLSVDEEGTSWLVQKGEEPDAAAAFDLEALSARLASAQRELATKSARLARALDEIERKLTENESLSEKLQHQSQMSESQQGELLAMTRQLHAGQEALLRVNQSIERQSGELRVAVGGRTRFYASMSHELRTPVNAVLGYNDLLLAGVYGELNEQQEIAIERSQRAVRHLRDLINDVLDLSGIESGRSSLEIRAVALEEVIGETVAVVEPMSRAQGTTLHWAGRCPAVLETDPRRLRQILLNLLSHAIKYGAGRPVWIRCEPSAYGGVDIEVVDNGPGISQEELAHVFDEFIPLAGQAQTGTGLGLSIALRLSRLLGGDLVAESTSGVGTTFRLKLPRKPPAV
jgi:signal transduction histidine kinase